MEEKVLCRIHYDTMIENLKRAAENGTTRPDCASARPLLSHPVPGPQTLRSSLEGALGIATRRLCAVETRARLALPAGVG